jgi:rhamnosyltransferase
MDICIVVPVLNASKDWREFSSGLLENLRYSGFPPDTVLVIDSSSTDDTASLVRSCGFQSITILRSDFDHGATRQLAVDTVTKANFFVYLTQDAVLASPDAIELLLRSFDDPGVGAAYGRQLPKAGARGVEAHARVFNYPAGSRTRALESRNEMGIKSIFLSDSFSAYRREALQAVGGFPGNVIFGEDTMIAGRLHLSGWKTAYVAEAAVFHSHSYSFAQEFRRYFDVGVLHVHQPWLLSEFGGAGGEGKRFVLSELAYLYKHAPLQIPGAFLRTGLKLLGYQLGLREAKLSPGMRLRLTMNKGYWNK